MPLNFRDKDTDMLYVQVPSLIFSNDGKGYEHANIQWRAFAVVVNCESRRRLDWVKKNICQWIADSLTRNDVVMTFWHGEEILFETILQAFSTQSQLEEGNEASFDPDTGIYNDQWEDSWHVFQYHIHGTETLTITFAPHWRAPNYPYERPKRGDRTIYDWYTRS